MKTLFLLLLTCPAFIFAQTRPDTISKSSNNKVNEPPVFLVVEDMPEYPGGNEAMFKFLAENIKYPLLARESAVQGTVYISFVITEKGEVTDIKVIRGVGTGLDEEAVRVVKMMPRWKPGKQSGKEVRVQYTLPIRFSLSDDSIPKK